MIKIEQTQQSIKTLKKLINTFGGAEVLKGILKLFEKVSSAAAGYVTKNYLTGQRLNIRSGMLARSVVGKGVKRKGVPGIQVGIFRGPALKYAGVQEYGTKRYNAYSPYDTIRPKNGKALAMPINDSLTAAGVSRYRSAKTDPRKMTFIPFKKNANIVGALYRTVVLKRIRKQKGSAFTLHDLKASYLLLKQVDVAPHWYLRDGMQEYLPVIGAELSRYLKDVLSGNRSL